MDLLWVMVIGELLCGAGVCWALRPHQAPVPIRHRRRGRGGQHS